MAEPEYIVDNLIRGVLTGQPHQVLDPLFIGSEARRS